MNGTPWRLSQNAFNEWKIYISPRWIGTEYQDHCDMCMYKRFWRLITDKRKVASQWTKYHIQSMNLCFHRSLNPRCTNNALPHILYFDFAFHLWIIVINIYVTYFISISVWSQPLPVVLTNSTPRIASTRWSVSTCLSLASTVRYWQCQHEYVTVAYQVIHNHSTLKKSHIVHHVQMMYLLRHCFRTKGYKLI